MITAIVRPITGRNSIWHSFVRTERAGTTSRSSVAAGTRPPAQRAAVSPRKSRAVECAQRSAMAASGGVRAARTPGQSAASTPTIADPTSINTI